MIIELNPSLKDMYNGTEWDIDVTRRIANRDIPWNEPLRYRPVDKVDRKTKLRNPGLVGLISHCYSQHIPLKINPDDIWTILISEVATVINSKTEMFRPLFTNSNNKKEISVPSGSMYELPIDLVVEQLSNLVNFDSNIITPKFSTTTPEHELVFNSILLDMASAYYDYSMFCCGIPRIKLGGTLEDWTKLGAHWVCLYHILKQYDNGIFADYHKRICEILIEIGDTANGNGNVDFWKDIFRQKNVGSGSQLEINGWIVNLFYTKHSFRKIDNFTTNVGVVRYTQLDTNTKYTMVCGGFDYENDDDGFAELTYSKHIFVLAPKENNK